VTSCLLIPSLSTLAAAAATVAVAIVAITVTVTITIISGTAGGWGSNGTAGGWGSNGTSIARVVLVVSDASALTLAADVPIALASASRCWH